MLYGGGKEFNPYQGDVGRVIDYMTALEAAIVPESDFVSRRLRERAQRLLRLSGDAGAFTKKVLNEMYAIRSTFVHGSPLDDKKVSLVQDRELWWRFEELVRKVLVEALRTVPSNDRDRRSYLTGLYDLSDADRAEKLRQDFGAIRDSEIKCTLLQTLGSKTQTPVPRGANFYRRILHVWRRSVSR
jgi:hypothetical protein